MGLGNLHEGFLNAKLLWANLSSCLHVLSVVCDIQQAVGQAVTGQQRQVPTRSMLNPETRGAFLQSSQPESLMWQKGPRLSSTLLLSMSARCPHGKTADCVHALLLKTNYQDNFHCQLGLLRQQATLHTSLKRDFRVSVPEASLLNRGTVCPLGADGAGGGGRCTIPVC